MKFDVVLKKWLFPLITWGLGFYFLKKAHSSFVATSVLAMFFAKELMRAWLLKKMGAALAIPYMIAIPFMLGFFTTVANLKGQFKNNFQFLKATLIPNLLCFALGLLALIAGLLKSNIAALPNEGMFMFYGQSLLQKWLSQAFFGQVPSAHYLALHDLAIVGQIVLTITALSLLPCGITDGGYIFRGLFRKHHSTVSWIVFSISMIMGMLFNATWFVFAALFLLLVSHPQLEFDEFKKVNLSDLKPLALAVVLMLLSIMIEPFAYLLL